MKTEDIVREELKEIVGCEVGQLTTFKQLKFNESDIDKMDKKIIEKYKLNSILSMKPDGWYFSNENDFALVCETKNSNEDICKNLNQLFSYMYIVNTKFRKVVGIIYNGNEFKVYRIINGDIIEYKCAKLENIKTYIDSFNFAKINKNEIFTNTKKINDLLHYDLNITNYKHRMIWTACLLVACRFGASYSYNDTIKDIKSKCINSLDKEIEFCIQKNIKLREIIKQFKSVSLNENISYETIKILINSINNISESITYNNWNGEDVMSIFFNEFNRYKSKSEEGQVFTPDHIASFMFQIANINYKDHILDACCGSGTFLTKSMSKMIDQVGGMATEEAKIIKQERIYGNELYPEIYVLACINMLLHKDGKTNLNMLDAKSKEAANWIKNSKITKVLMNPPYEKKTKPLDIISNVLDNVKIGATCLFLMPNSKLRTNLSKTKKILNNHKLTHIIKLPDIFSGVASTGDVSIFIFKAHEPQNNEKIIGYWIKEDGLETVKNQGRHDINGIWQNELEKYWINVFKTGDEPRYNTKKIIDPNESLEYPDEEIDEPIFEEDFEKVILDRILFENKELNDILSEYSPKNNPNGISHKDWIIKTIAMVGKK